MAETNVLSAILAVFEMVAEWIGTAISSLTPMFYVAETGLTFLGVLAVAGLAFSVVFLKSKFWEIGCYNSDVIVELP